MNVIVRIAAMLPAVMPFAAVAAQVKATIVLARSCRQGGSPYPSRRGRQLYVAD
jgi:hypothetical protein